MRVELGNPRPTTTDGRGPVVTYMGPLPEDPEYGYSPHESAAVLADKLAAHVTKAGGGVTRAGDISDGTGHHEAFLTALASWRTQSDGNPSWVWSDNEDFAVLLGAFFDCPVGRPSDVELTHYTHNGVPGVGPAAEVDA